MKLTIFGLLACCLVLTNAGAVDHIGQTTKTMESYADSLTELAEHVAKDVEHKYDEIVVQPLAHVEASVNAIEERKQENMECVVAHEAEVENVVNTVEDSINMCGKTAATDSATVGYEIGKVSTEIVYDSMDVVKTYQRCQKYSNPILANTCYTKLTIKATKLLVKTKRAIKLVNKSVDETLPQILHDLEDCSAAAEESALSELEVIHSDVDSCIAAYKKSNTN